jgi:hypothetical protein
MDFEESGVGAWTGFICLRTVMGGGLLWMRSWKSGILKIPGISWLVEELWASQEGHCSIELVCTVDIHYLRVCVCVCARARAHSDILKKLYDKRGFFVQCFQSLLRRGVSYIFLDIQGSGRRIVQNYILHEYWHIMLGHLYGFGPEALTESK